MSVCVSLTVRLRVPDTTALSAEDILKRKMGYGARLVNLERADWWHFDVAGDDPSLAVRRVGEWAGRVTSLVNPNKHRATIEPILEWPPTAKGPGIKVLVRDRDDVRAESMTRFLRESLGALDLAALESGTLWTVHLGVGVGDGASLAEEIARTRSRQMGLLMNPHAQVCEVWE